MCVRARFLCLFATGRALCGTTLTPSSPGILYLWTAVTPIISVFLRLRCAHIPTTVHRVLSNSPIIDTDIPCVNLSANVHSVNNFIVCIERNAFAYICADTHVCVCVLIAVDLLIVSRSQPEWHGRKATDSRKWKMVKTLANRHKYSFARSTPFCTVQRTTKTKNKARKSWICVW